MPFYVCYYHMVWTTKNRQPIITPHIEMTLLAAIERKSRTLNSPIHAINATEDHIHVAVSIAPNVSLSEWVKGVKGLSTRKANEHLPHLETRFQWQSGYGALTFGAKNLPFVIAYIQNQKEHHRNGSTDAYLEQTEDTP